MLHAFSLAFSPLQVALADLTPTLRAYRKFFASIVNVELYVRVLASSIPRVPTVFPNRLQTLKPTLFTSHISSHLNHNWKYLFCHVPLGGRGVPVKGLILAACILLNGGLVSHIFRNRSKLSPRYIPDRLPHREKQLESLLSIYSPSLENVGGAFLQPVQLIGGVGAGKTCTAMRFGSVVEKEASKRRVSLKHVYVNGKVDGANRYTLYRRILDEACPSISSRGLSPEDMLVQMVKQLRRESRYVIITFDEVDYFCKRSKEHVVYDLTRLNEVSPGEPCNVLGVLFIARDPSYRNLLDPAETSTMGLCVIRFHQYNAEQIRDILAERVELAFKPGAVSDEVLDFVSDITAKPPVNGDARFALDLLQYAGNLAENMGFERILPDHVRRVYGEMHPAVSGEDISSLTRTGKLVLLGLARALKASETPYVSLREVRDYYNVVCEEYEVKPSADFEENLQSLIDMGIVEMKSLTRIGILNVTAEDLDRFLNSIIKHVGSSADEG
jgi:cell division control protein 6